MFGFIEKLDDGVLKWFQSMHSTFFDVFFWNISEAWVFLPLWLWALYEVIKEYGIKQIGKVIVIVGLTILISDQVSHVFKYQVKRLRPTYNVYYQDKIHLVNHYRGGQYGFYSAHASNSAAIAVLVILFVRKHSLKYWILFYPLLSGISRMYLGVHFFTDVLFGWFMGSIIAYFVFLLIKSKLVLKEE